MSYVGAMTEADQKMKRFTAWLPEPMLEQIEQWGRARGVKTSTALRMLLIEALAAQDSENVSDAMSAVMQRIGAKDVKDAAEQLVQWYLQREREGLDEVAPEKEALEDLAPEKPAKKTILPAWTSRNKR